MSGGIGFARVRFVSALVAAVAVLGCLAVPALAVSEGPGWELFGSAYPTNFRVGGVDEVQEVAPNPAEATFTLTFQGEKTGAIPVGASAAAIQAALEALASIGKEGVAVEAQAAHPGVFDVTFEGLLGNMKVALLEAGGATTAVKTEGSGSGTIGIDVFNVGARPSGGTITITDTLPPGVKAKEAGRMTYPGEELYGSHFGIDPDIEKSMWDCTGNGPGIAPSVAGATVVTCTNDPVGLPTLQGGGGTPELGTNEGSANPQPVVGIAVEAQAEASGLRNRVSIAGGGAPTPASAEDPVTISSAPPKEGLAHADVWFSNANGTIDTQAGSHPYTATFVFDIATELNGRGEGQIAGGEIRELTTHLPPGFVGDLHDIAQCTRRQLLVLACPVASMVGTLKAWTIGSSVTKTVFNMVPPPGVPAELGFEYAGNTVYISFDVQTGGDYSIVAHVPNIPQAGLFHSILTLWGVPAEASHDRWRGQREGGCTQEELEQVHGFGEPYNYCTEQPSAILAPFLTLPTSCREPQQFHYRELSSWQNPNAKSAVSFLTHDASGKPSGFTGCESLDFEPVITTAPDTAKADTPAGVTVEVKPPLGGLEIPGAFGSADIQNTTVALPPGLVINPGQGAGLQACGPGEDALTTEAEKAKGEEGTGPAACPNASKIGTVTIKSPLIEADPEKQFEGNVYLLQSNPPQLRLLLAASADGVNLKLVGESSLCESVGEVLYGKTCEAAGQIVTTFLGTPQLPFTVFKLSFSGGAQAALDTPLQCGTYTSNADFTPWSSPLESDLLTSASFSISEGPDGTGCPSNPMPFAPSLTAGATTDHAGGFTSFSMLLQRGDGQQRIEKLSFKAPQGLSAMLSQVSLCDEAHANAGTCPASSHIGHAVVASGPGPYPLVIPQPGEPEAPIFLTGPYKGAPFGLSIVTPVIAGPFNLGTIVTRASIAVDPQTTQITVTTDPLPQLVKGVPTDLREVNAVIDRPGFMFNPTSCAPQEFTGTATSAGGAATAPLANHFGVGSCRELDFHPRFTAGTSGSTSRANGASLKVSLAYPKAVQGTQANVASVKVELPKALPSRLTTLQKACVASVFAANPARCPADSVVGHAVVHTQILPVPLEGPAYFVSHGGEAFPNLVIVLQGYGVTVQLVGSTFISKAGITSSTFKTAPDVPFETFELTLPQGPYSALAANGDLCQQKLIMPIALTRQNGAQLNENTHIEVEGCSKALSFVSKKLRGRSLTLRIAVPAAGNLQADGRGLSSGSTSTNGRGTVTIKLHVKRGGKKRFTSKVHLTFTPSSGKDRKKSSTTVSVRV